MAATSAGNDKFFATAISLSAVRNASSKPMLVLCPPILIDRFCICDPASRRLRFTASASRPARRHWRQLLQVRSLSHHSLVLFKSAANPIFKLAVPLRKSGRHDVSSARRVDLARHVTFNDLPEMELVHHRFVLLAGICFFLDSLAAFVLAKSRSALSLAVFVRSAS
jgi:hypothetical protein